MKAARASIAVEAPVRRARRAGRPPSSGGGRPAPGQPSRRDAHAPRRLIIKSPGSLTFVTFDEIDWMSAAGSCVRVYAGGTVHVARESMNRMEARLDARFARVHRSAIVNTDRIRRISTGESGRVWVVLEDGTEVPAGHHIDERLKQWTNDAC